VTIRTLVSDKYNDAVLNASQNSVYFVSNTGSPIAAFVWRTSKGLRILKK